MGGGGNGEPGGAFGGRGRWTWGGGGVPGGVGGSGSGGGGGWGWGSCMAGGGRRSWTWGGGSACGGVGSVGAVGECAVRGGSGSAAVCGTGPHRSSRASQEASAGPGGLRVVTPGTRGGGGGPPSSMDPPRRGVVAATAGGMGRVTVLGGVGPKGPLRRGRGGRGDTETVPGTEGVAGTRRVVPGGRWGMQVERSVAAIPFAGAVRARGVVARWCRAVGSGSGGGGVGSGGGGAAGGGGVGSGGVGVAGMAHGPLVGFPVPLVGVGGFASWAVPGAALCGGQGGRVGGRA